MTYPIATPAQERSFVRDIGRRHRRSLVAIVLLVAVSTAMVLAAPVLLGVAIDYGVSPGEVRVVYGCAIALAATASIGFLAQRRLIELMARVAEDVIADLRVRVFEATVALSLADLEAESRGALVARLTNDVDTIAENLRYALPTFVRSVALLLLSGAVLVVISPVLALVTLVGVPPVAIAAVRYQRVSPRAYGDHREAFGVMVAGFAEGIAGVRVTRAFGQEARQAATFAPRTAAVVAAALVKVRTFADFYPVVQFTQAAVVAAILVAGVALADTGVVTVGDIGVFVLSIANVFGPITELSDWWDTLQSGRAALARVVGLMNMPSALAEGTLGLAAPGRLILDAVTFGYVPSRPVVQEVNLKLRPGERLALVGATGAGKSTIARLAARLADPQGGVVRFGDVDLREARLASVRRAIVVLSQEGHIFPGTVLDNVRLAHPGASEDDVIEALTRADALGLVQALPDGLDTDVSSDGARLSAGQRQLVSLSRLALLDPAIVILDESTSSLDPATEARVETSLRSVLAGRSVIVIAHRLETAARADRIAVIDGGRVAEVGRHQDLLGAGGIYAAMWDAWGLSRAE